MMNLKKISKFFIASGIGALLDFAVGLVLVFWGIPLPVSAVTGFSTAILVTYWIHIHWTFNIKDSPFISVYLLKFVLGSILTILTRLLVLYLGISLFTIDGTGKKTLLLAFSIGISFCLNYILSTLWSFSNIKKYK